MPVSRMLISIAEEASPHTYFGRFFFAAFFFRGTFAPSFLASESPMAIACFLLVTFFPLLPDFNLPSFCSCNAFFTFFRAFFEYFAIMIGFIVLRPPYKIKYLSKRKSEANTESTQNYDSITLVSFSLFYRNKKKWD